MVRSLTARHARATADADSAPFASEDVAAFAFRCHAHGATEEATATLLRSLARQGVRSLAKYTRNWTDADVTRWLSVAEVLQEQEPVGRGDLIRIRGKARWPWRTSTSQPLGGAVG